MSDNICGRCDNWYAISDPPRYGYCQAHDRYNEYSDTCSDFVLSQRLLDNLRPPAETDELAKLRAQNKLLRDALAEIAQKAAKHVQEDAP